MTAQTKKTSKEEEFLLRIQKLKNMLNFTKNGYSDESIIFSEEPIVKSKRTFIKLRYHAGKNENKKTVGDFLAYVTDYGAVKKLATEGKYNEKTKASIKIQLPTVEPSEVAGLLSELNIYSNTTNSNQETMVSSQQMNKDLNEFFASNKFYAVSEFEGELKPGITAGYVHCLDSGEKERLSRAFNEIGVVEDKDMGDEKSMVIFAPVVPLEIKTPRIRQFKDIADVIKKAIWLIKYRLKIEITRGDEIKESEGFPGKSSPFSFENVDKVTEAKKILRIYGFHICKETEDELSFRLSFDPTVEPLKTISTPVSNPTKIIPKEIYRILNGQKFYSRPLVILPLTKYATFISKTNTINISGEGFTNDEFNSQIKELMLVFEHNGYEAYFPRNTKRNVRKSFALRLKSSTAASSEIVDQSQQSNQNGPNNNSNISIDTLISLFTPKIWHHLLENAPMAEIEKRFPELLQPKDDTPVKILEIIQNDYMLIPKDHPMVAAINTMDKGVLTEAKDVKI